MCFSMVWGVRSCIVWIGDIVSSLNANISNGVPLSGVVRFRDGCIVLMKPSKKVVPMSSFVGKFVMKPM